MSLREVWIAMHKFPENADGACRIVFLTQDQAQLNTRVRVPGIKAQGVVQFAYCLVELPGLRQGKTEIIVRLRKISIRHYRLLELLKRAITVVLAPEKKSEAGVDLSIVGFQLQSFAVSILGACVIQFAVPGDTKIVVAGRQLWTLVNRLLKEIQSFIQLLLLQRVHTLKDKELSLGEASAKAMQFVQLIQLFVGRSGIPLGTESDP